VPDDEMAAEWVARQGSGENVHQAMLSSGGRVNASNCRSLWEGVVGGVPATVDDVEDGPNGYLVRNSVMESFTQHNPVRHTTPDHARPRQTTPGHARPCHTRPHHAKRRAPGPFDGQSRAPDPSLARRGCACPRVASSRVASPPLPTMTSMFFERPQRPCLSADDVEGLATLYPDCSPQAITRVVCITARSKWPS